MKNSDFISKKKKKEKEEGKRAVLHLKKKINFEHTCGVKPSSLTNVLQILLMITLKF